MSKQHSKDKNGTVYLIHLAIPINPTRPAQHYLGYTANLARRLKEHGTPQGSAMLRVATARGIAWHVVATWPGGPGAEVQFKRMRNHRKLCPVCTPPKPKV